MEQNQRNMADAMDMVAMMIAQQKLVDDDHGGYVLRRPWWFGLEEGRGSKKLGKKLTKLR